MCRLYIHIPFCVSRCGYCDFFSTGSLPLMDRYVESLIDEMDAQRDFLRGGALATVYFGGGTPSLLSPALLSRISGAIAERWDCGGLEETTLEANPDDLSPQYLEALGALPFDRLSIGVQSFDDGLLRFLGRRHTAASAVEAVENARRAGFDNISLDLIYGIPGMDRGQWEASVDKAVSLGAEHISAYHLTIEPDSAFGRNKVRPVPEERSGEQYSILCAKMAAAGYEHYEISNFALPGRRARHNSAYWKGEPYLGLGPGAHSYDGERLRRWCVPSLKEYLAAPRYESETLSPKDIYNEYVMTRMRTSEGVDLREIEKKFGAEALRRFDLRAASHISAGTLTEKEGRVAFRPAKFLVSDDVISSLFE